MALIIPGPGARGRFQRHFGTGYRRTGVQVACPYPARSNVARTLNVNGLSPALTVPKVQYLGCSVGTVDSEDPQRLRSGSFDTQRHDANSLSLLCFLTSYLQAHRSLFHLVIHFCLILSIDVSADTTRPQKTEWETTKSPHQHKYRPRPSTAGQTCHDCFSQVRRETKHISPLR